MTVTIPRVLLAGTNSGCGKTTVTCAILQALINRGLRAGAFKCGPDYIDPMFHSRIIGARSTNLDLYFFSANTVRALLIKNGSRCDFSVMEGVMGYYDGLGLTNLDASSCELAQVTSSPVILVVNARGLSLSLLAIIQGFLDFHPNNQIAGVILNQCTAMTYPALAQAIRRQFSIEPLGYLPPMPECSLQSRHLGLVTAEEVADLKEKMQRLAAQAEQSLDLDGILKLGHQAPALSCRPVVFPVQPEPVRIAVARDRAFCFYYEDSLDALREMGAELVPFSPLTDAALPDHIQGLYLGGGYPELYARALSENTSMLASIRQALESRLPCIAECGGFMYLTEAIAGCPMVGFLKGEALDTGKLVRFGYVMLTAEEDNLLCPAGGTIAAHEFHHWDCTDPGSSYTARKHSGRNWHCVHATPWLYAGFPHFHFYANPDFAVHFYNACLKEKHHD